MKKLRQTQAIVLRETDFGESDKLLTLFSTDVGKMQCIAKGAKRSKKRFVNKLEQFTLLEVTYAAGNGSLHRLDQAEVIDYFEKLRFEYQRYIAAVLAGEMILQWIRENDADHASFDLFVWTLQQLNCANNLSATLIFFFVKLLTLQGYRPVFDACTACGTPIAARQRYSFSPRRFGIVCNSCQGDPSLPLYPLSLGLLKLLANVQHLEKEKLPRLLFKASDSQDSFRLLEKYFSFLLQRDFSSWKVTEKILFAPKPSA